ncbi:MAG: flagellar hook-basal body complex protein [Lachnospiraceae bacterium]|nr:flagellar hook-basal body complex protein [Lachnospiraceae bacterium]
MMRSLFSGVAGLKTHQTKMDVIGNNISNVNTVAFKSSGVNFADIMYQTTSRASGATATTGGVNAKQIGLGVSTASTKVKITNGGSAQSTGDALDIRLSDANSTNFFIVNNGNQNLFTRDGSFYIDGNGNLAMTSTGYLVMGWQVNQETMTIQKDTVSALRIMDAKNLTSAPEATKEATASGLIDKNDSNVASQSGYVMSLGFYDSLGYAYTAKFSVKGYDVDDTMNVTGKTETTTGTGDSSTSTLAKLDALNTYTIELTGIFDADNNDILAKYLNESTVDANGAKLTGDAYTKAYNVALEKIFGLDGMKETESTYAADAEEGHLGGKKATNFDVISGVTYNAGVFTKKIDGVSYSTAVNPTITAQGKLAFYPGGDTTATTKVVNVNIEDVFAISPIKADASGSRGAAPTAGTFVPVGTKVTYSIDGGTLRAVEDTVSYFLNFNHADGKFANIAGQQSQSLKMSVLGSQFSDVNIDFSSVLNFDNGGTSTMGLDRGSLENASVGAGKKLGAMTGLSVQQNGEVYGSYDNGNTVLLGQIAVAQFANASGLESLGNNCYNTTLNSGDFDGIGVDVTADGGKMNTGQLEMSNVDLSQEFTDMITTQRGFQANSRIISVSDTMLEELTNLKR